MNILTMMRMSKFFLAVWQFFVERRYCSVCPIIHVLATVGHCCYDEDIEDANRELGIGN